MDKFHSIVGNKGFTCRQLCSNVGNLVFEIDNLEPMLDNFQLYGKQLSQYYMLGNVAWKTKKILRTHKIYQGDA